MTERINTTLASFDGGSFSPAGDWSVQAEIDPKSNGVVEAQCRVDAAAPWVPLGAISKLTSPPVMSFAKVPFARLVLAGNTAGLPVKAWSAE